MHNKRTITVFEHESLRFDREDNRLCKNDIEKLLPLLQKHYGKGVPYYKLVYNGVQFNEYVGVIQIGNRTIEVLPKTDKNIECPDKEGVWRSLLIGMLRVVLGFEIKATSSATRKIRPNTILDLYFELFIKEVEYLLHQGLLRKYRKKEGNSFSLKGSLNFNKHIAYNLTHQERFYVRYNTYDVNHQLHYILYKTIELLYKINTNHELQSRIGALLLNFPEMPDVKVTEKTFDRIVYNRKTITYKKAIEISKMLLLKYHPDLSSGSRNVLALMFDMNLLWEKFVYRSLKIKPKDNTVVKEQIPKSFWKPIGGNVSSIRSDIFVKRNNKNFVLDTKWKNLNGKYPSAEDLKQMYTYNEYYGAEKIALVYPGNPKNDCEGMFCETPSYGKRDKECSLIYIDVPGDIERKKSSIRDWQDEIQLRIFRFTDRSSKH